MEKIRAIITGATGMVGEGVLTECIDHPDVESILLLTRRTSGFIHPKIRELVHNDFYNLSAVENQLTGYNACFFCLGVSSLGMNESDYRKVTYDLTMHVAQTLSKLNKNMVFCYISGAGTDSSEKGSIMWARIKGKTENDLTKLPFRDVYNFRPAFLKASKGAKNTLPYYKYVSWLFPLFRPILPQYMGTLRELGRAMINAVKFGYPRKVLTVQNIRELSGENE
jgi:nucleoside-diphosphate-sugar epimerase